MRPLKKVQGNQSHITSLIMVMGELLSNQCPSHEELNFSAGIAYTLTNCLGYSDDTIRKINTRLVENINTSVSEKDQMIEAFNENYRKLPAIIQTLTT